MSVPQNKPNAPKKRRGGGAASSGFAASVIHYRTGKRIYPKTAKAFPLRARRTPVALVGGATGAPSSATTEQLALPFEDEQGLVGNTETPVVAVGDTLEPVLAAAPSPRKRRSPPTPRK